MWGKEPHTTHGSARPLRNPAPRRSGRGRRPRVCTSCVTATQAPCKVGSSTPTLGVRYYGLSPDTQLREPKPSATSEVWVFLGHWGRASGVRSGTASHLSQIKEPGKTRHRPGLRRRLASGAISSTSPRGPPELPSCSCGHSPQDGYVKNVLGLLLSNVTCSKL